MDSVYENTDPSWLFDEKPLETAETIEPRQLKLSGRRRNLAAIKQERLEDFLVLPEPGESIHIVSNGRFDYWNFCPVILSKTAKPARSFYGSTWTMNRANVLDLLGLYDAGKITAVSILTGTYFKRRESSVCNTLVEGLLSRGQRYRAFQNHAKVMLLEMPPDYFSIEGSANFTANPRLEQTVISNERSLWEFHRAWFEEMLA